MAGCDNSRLYLKAAIQEEGAETGAMARNYSIRCKHSWMTDSIVIHKVMQNLGIEAGINMASEYGSRDIEAAANLALCQTMDILCQVVSKTSPVTVLSK
jgi:hypothetical protein